MADYSDYIEPGAVGAAGLRAAWPFIKPVISRVGGPLTALLGDTRPLNAGEQDLYVRGPDGKMMPNPNNPLARPLAGPMPGGSPMSPMPASDPFPLRPNGMNPANPSLFAPPSAPAPQPGASAPPASLSPSPPSGSFLPPALGPLSAPGLQGPSGGFGPAPGGGGAPAAGTPMDLAAPGQAPNSSLYGADAGGFGPGGPSTAANYSPLGFMTGAPQNGNFNLGNFLKGGTDAQSALQAAPDKPFWNIARMLNKSFGGGYSGSDSAIS